MDDKTYEDTVANEYFTNYPFANGGRNLTT